MSVTAHTVCRVCGTPRLFRWLDLGTQPLANAVRSADAPLRDEFRAPLAVAACPDCKLSQLTHVVAPTMLYARYNFQAGISAGWRAHCDALAHTLGRAGAVVLDIASNDGTLLRAFAARGCTTLGVEPAQDFAGPGVRTAFWSSALARDPEIAGRVDVLTATNVLGHVDDVHDFMAGVEIALAPSGIAVIEVPYLGKLLDTLAFDTIYHEHLSYWSVTALKRLCSAHGLTLWNVIPQAIHGGSIRALIAREGTPSAAVTHYLVAEHHDFRRHMYQRASAHITRRIADINEALLDLEYVGFGASAKAAVLLGTLDVRALPRAIYDETRAKQGHRMPGTQVPILAPPLDWRMEPRPLVIFAWNWARDLAPRFRAAGFTGPILVPQPTPRWLDE